MINQVPTKPYKTFSEHEATIFVCADLCLDLEVATQPDLVLVKGRIIRQPIKQADPTPWTNQWKLPRQNTRIANWSELFGLNPTSDSDQWWLYQTANHPSHKWDSYSWNSQGFDFFWLISGSAC